MERLLLLWLMVLLWLLLLKVMEETEEHDSPCGGQESSLAGMMILILIQKILVGLYHCRSPPGRQSRSGGASRG